MSGYAIFLVGQEREREGGQVGRREQGCGDSPTRAGGAGHTCVWGPCFWVDCQWVLLGHFADEKTEARRDPTKCQELPAPCTAPYRGSECGSHAQDISCSRSERGRSRNGFLQSQALPHPLQAAPGSEPAPSPAHPSLSLPGWASGHISPGHAEAAGPGGWQGVAVL